MKIGNRFFDTQNHTYIMGILNITPDSFSDGGKWNHLDEALRHTEAMIADGADIIDIGGESTRPGHTPVSAEEEAQRVLPVIEAVRKRFDIPISVDTFKSSVAESAIQAGADLVNDIWGLKYDSEMGAVIAKYDVACCLMHNKSNTEYNNFLIDMLSETQECVNLARKAGIKDEKIILDPGVGFGKTFEMNLETMKHLELFKNLGFPVLLGTSRKSMIGLALDLPVDQRVEGTLATSVIGVMKGCSFVRVHDVKENRRVIQMTFCNGIVKTENGVISCTIDIRVPVTFKKDDILNRIEGNLEDENGRIEVGEIGNPLFFPRESPLVNALYKAYVDVTGDTENKPMVIGGGTYAKSLKNIIAFGPEKLGVDYRIHGADEFILVSEMEEAVEVYMEAIKNLLAI